MIVEATEHNEEYDVVGEWAFKCHSLEQASTYLNKSVKEFRRVGGIQIKLDNGNRINFLKVGSTKLSVTDIRNLK